LQQCIVILSMNIGTQIYQNENTINILFFTDLSSSLLRFPAVLGKWRCRPGLCCEGTHKFSAQSKQEKAMIHEYDVYVFLHQETWQLLSFLSTTLYQTLFSLGFFYS